MRSKEVTVTCVYDESGDDLRRIVQSSFAAFLKKELESGRGRPGRSPRPEG